MQKKPLYLCLVTIITVLTAGSTNSADLDAGIAIDTAVDDSLKTRINIPYILMKAKAAELRSKKGIKSTRPVITQGENGQGNINFGIGTKIAPGTTIVNSSEIKNANSISR
ncbi:MAG: hypothetical protein V3U88_08500 [Methylococcales bacterium]